MTLAILCSGQGRQHPDMFALTGDAPEAAGLFAHAATLLGGRDPREIVRTETSEAAAPQSCRPDTLHAAGAGGRGGAARRDARPAHRRRLQRRRSGGLGRRRPLEHDRHAGPRRAPGRSHGCRHAARRRAAVRSRALAARDIDRLCERHEAAIAIVNPGDAFVLGGGRAALEALADEAKAMNATRVVDLPVEVASHTKRLAEASAAFRESLSRCPDSSRRPPARGS